MNDVPLIQKADINSINTSIIAIKKQLKQLTEAVGLIDVPDVDTSVFVKKTDVADVVEADNMNPVTSNAVAEYTVDEVTSGNMHSVTSNAVAQKFRKLVWFKVRNATKKTPSDRAYFTITDFFPNIANNYVLVAGHGICNNGGLEAGDTVTSNVDTAHSNLIYLTGRNFTMQANTTYSGINFDIFTIKIDLFTEYL